MRRLRNGAESLSRNQRMLAKHVLGHYEGVAFSTVKELSTAAGVSEATVVRFAKALGFKGYPDLQREIRRVVRADMKGTERFKLTYAVKEPPKKGPLSAIIEREIDNISALQDTLDLKTLERAARMLREASEVMIVGTRSSAPLAHHMWFGLNKIEIKATRELAVTTETYDRLARMDAKSCVVVIGFPRYLRELVELLDFAKNRELKTLAITDSPYSALRGDLNLHAPVESAAYVASHCAPLILINGLMHEVSLLDKARTLKALNRFEALADSQAYFQTA
ncbi:MAG: MurR/RpiR family transcriptional regulator [Betaproteobacteria bacterium]|nr:MurR/RpiR family transcriptional regulator [Betaproteobacteria bacterium]